MKRLLMLFVGVFASLAVLLADNEKLVTKDQLPAEAQKFINTYFPNDEISYAKKEIDVVSVTYDVIFVSGKKVEFDRSGNWTSVDCGKRVAVPSAIVPKPIQDYVGKMFAAEQIVDIDRDSFGWEVKLTNGLEIKFNNKFGLRELDD